MASPGFANAQNNLQAKATIYWGWDGVPWNVPDSFIKNRINHIKETGYSGITFDYHMMVTNDGTLTDAYKVDRMYTFVKYAVSIGLAVDAKVHWVNKDNWNLNPYNTPSTFDYNKFINSAGLHLVESAKLLEKYGASGIYLGTEADNFFTTQYKSQWAKIVSDIRSVFHGKVYYDALYFGLQKDTFNTVDVWEFLDAITVSFYPHLSSAPVTDQRVIESLFVSPNMGLLSGYTFLTDKQCAWSTPVPSIVGQLIEVSKKYGKPVTFGEINYQPVSSNLCGWIPDADLVSNNVAVDLDAQKRVYIALFETLNNHLNGVVTGITIYGYDIWTQFRTDTYGKWTPYNSMSDSPAEEAMKPYLKQWNPTPVVIPTPTDPTPVVAPTVEPTVTLPVYPGPNTTVSVTLKGKSGSVSTSIVGIDCGTRCSYVFTKGSTIVLTATPAPGQKFKNWGGACGGNRPTCRLRLNGFTKNVAATFK